MHTTEPKPDPSFLDRWVALSALPRSEIIAVRVVLGLLVIVGIGVSLTDFGLRGGLSIWLALATYAGVLILLLRSVTQVHTRPRAWPFWPYFCAAAVAGVVGRIIAGGEAMPSLMAVALSAGLVYGGSHWLLVRFLQRMDRS